jgi:nucleoside-diphosphate-sugar epimerase
LPFIQATEGVIMRVLVAGGTGVIGRRLVPLLGAVGHEVVPLRRADVDVLDADAVRRFVGEVEPDAVVSMLTAIPATLQPRKLASQFALTNRLRTEGTRNLLAAAPGARFIAQGLAYAYQPADGLAGEDAPLWTTRTPKPFAPVLDALIEQERLASAGLVLRLGHLYGPGSAFDVDGSFTQQVRAGKVPLVGGGHAVFSFTHADDAATAVIAALDKPAVTGVLNIVDDTPVRLAAWLPEVARMLGARPPRVAPAALARLAVGGWGVAYLNELRGADNARARLRLDWRPRHPSWAEGFAEELARV